MFVRGYRGNRDILEFSAPGNETRQRITLKEAVPAFLQIAVNMQKYMVKVYVL